MQSNAARLRALDGYRREYASAAGHVEGLLVRYGPHLLAVAEIGAQQLSHNAMNCTPTLDALAESFGAKFLR